MRKVVNPQPQKEDNTFSMSTGDLMAGLLFVFILLLMSAMMRVQQKEEIDAQIVQQYDKVKTQLCIDLQEEFKDDLSSWRAEVDSTLCVRFQEPTMLFDNNKAELKPLFKKILADFFPRYIQVLSKPEYRDNIMEIRIEGHTDSNGEYFHNMELSQNRTRAVLEYCFSLMSEQEQEWAKKIITANGLSSSQLIYVDGVEDKALSRRVEFRVRTNAEKQIEEIAIRRELH